jgi:membrane-bound lytic murein transglycosylase
LQTLTHAAGAVPGHPLQKRTLSNEGEPVGAQGVPLMPGRSIAVDRLHEYGTPFFIEANLPAQSLLQPYVA